MQRIPLTFRALLLVPLLSVAVDQTRATLLCGTRAESCLEAAGRGWSGPAGVVLLVLYALGLAWAIGRAAGGSGAPVRSASTLRLWATGTAGVAAVCGGQALLVGALDDSASLGGGWGSLLALCAVAGALIALALRVAPAAAALVGGLRPAAPRPAPVAPVALALPSLPLLGAHVRRTPATAGRAPPSD